MMDGNYWRDQYLQLHSWLRLWTYAYSLESFDIKKLLLKTKGPIAFSRILIIDLSRSQFLKVACGGF
jgi:hypothetical protein